MKKSRKLLALLLALTLVVSLCACSNNTAKDGSSVSEPASESSQSSSSSELPGESSEPGNEGTTVITSDSADKAEIEAARSTLFIFDPDAAEDEKETAEENGSPDMEPPSNFSE